MTYEQEKAQGYGVPIEDVTCWNCGRDGVMRIPRNSTLACGSVEVVCDCVWCPVIDEYGDGDLGIEGDPHICDICEEWEPRR